MSLRVDPGDRDMNLHNRKCEKCGIRLSIEDGALCDICGLRGHISGRDVSKGQVQLGGF